MKNLQYRGAIHAPVILMIAVIVSVPGCNARTTHTSRDSVENIIASEFQTIANQQKQQIFNNLHPVGTAKSVTIHDVTIVAWKHGRATNRIDDVLQFTVRYTLYWQGPMTQDGYTKISETFDTETQRSIAGQILATNGITNENVGEAIGSMLFNYLNN